MNYPKITVVTPSYNQAQYLGETITSILDQQYPDLEYLVMDGGSNDGSVEVIKRYAAQIAFWVSEKDRGQSHAINKGFSRATGEIVAWLNSDDCYYPGALLAVGRYFAEHPECSWLICAVDNFLPDGKIQNRVEPAYDSLPALIGRKNYKLHQPGIFWRRSALEKVGLLDESIHYSFDHDYWIRLALAGFQPHCLNLPAARFRLHPTSKTQSNFRYSLSDDWKILARYRDRLSQAEWQSASDSLKEYEAGYLIETAYTILLAKGRWQALSYLLSRISLLPWIKPTKLYLGAVLRIIAGKPASWYLTKRQLA